jgi:hypothetical protein
MQNRAQLRFSEWLRQNTIRASLQEALHVIV